MAKITKIKGRQVFDSRGNPTVEAEVFSDNGMSASAICPSGASTGTYEAFEKRDGNKKIYLGKSVFKAVDIINKKISKSLKGIDSDEQMEIDDKLKNLDKTKQKIRLGANSILPVSIAVKKLAAKNKKKPLYQHIRYGCYKDIQDLIINNNYSLPYPLMNIINGGVHADNGLRIQEFMIRPDGAKNFSEALHMCFLVINNLKLILHKRNLSISVGDEGGFAPKISSNEKALELIIQAINKSGYKNGENISICLDVAANELTKIKSGRNHISWNYSIKSKQYEDASKTREYYLKLIKNYKIKSIEDPFHEDDNLSWLSLTNQTTYYSRKTFEVIGNTQIVGDDIFATNEKRLFKGQMYPDEERIGNAIIIKPNQVGTLTDTLGVIGMAKRLKYKTIISHRSGDSEDTFIADLAVGTGSEQIKTGSLARSERVAKYNRLLRIEEELGKHAKMANI
jgi:enolase